METRNTFATTGGLGAVALLALASAGSATAQVTSRVSVSSSGAQGNGQSYATSISGDGRYVAFWSDASNLVAGDTNGAFGSDIFVRDRLTGVTGRVSVDSAGAQSNGGSVSPSISADGRYVAFASNATNLVPGDTNATWDIFVHDRQSGVTERVSIDSGGTEGNSSSHRPSISADGRYVAFESNATNLVAGGDTNGNSDILVHDRQTGATERVSVSSGGTQGNSGNGHPSISADGRYVAFFSQATNLVVGDTNGAFDVFVRDRQSAVTERVTVSSGGAQSNNGSWLPSISADGNYVAFWSGASNLVAGDTNAVVDIFVRDRQSGLTERVSVDSGGAQANAASDWPWISADGRYVAFDSNATNLVAGDTNARQDVFVHDLQSGLTERVSLRSNGTQANQNSDNPSISADGRYVAFDSGSNNLVSGDTGGWNDAFVHDRDYTPMTSLCDPGVSGVIACPCANPPSGAGLGCNNSANTGGANLSASGVAYLTQDTLVFTTSGEKPTATSIVAQWTGTNAAGVVFGQGVRCTSGSLKRLYTKSAVGGSITAPDFGAGDPTVSARSAALGDTIPAGASRWYLVYYRDPIVLGGCPATSSFNATQTGRVEWIF